MSRKIRYSNGYVGQVSDAVAEILVSKGEAVVIYDRPGAPLTPPEPAKVAKGAQA